MAMVGRQSVWIAMAVGVGVGGLNAMAAGAAFGTPAPGGQGHVQPEAPLYSGRWMAGEDIVATFKGVTIGGHYADKRHFTERYGADGKIVYEEPYRRNVGRWSVRGGAFCTIYDRDPTGGCYRVRRLSKNCFAFYFVARTGQQAEETPLGDPKWTAKGWRTDSPSTCEEAGVV